MSHDEMIDPDPQFADEALEKRVADVSPDVVGLLNVGHISHTFTWCGHTFRMETPCIEEEMAADELIDGYSGTLAKGKSLYVAKVAAALREVDGRPIHVPLEKDEAPGVRVRKTFDYLKTRYRFVVIEVLYKFWQELESRQINAVWELEGKSMAGHAKF